MKKKAFTLIELLVVVVIIGILATLVTLALNSATRSAKDAKAKTAIEQVQSAVMVAVSADDKIPTDCPVGSWINLADTSGTGAACKTALGTFSAIPVDAQGKGIKLWVTSATVPTFIVSGQTSKSTPSTEICWYVTQDSKTGLTTPSSVSTYCDQL